MKAPPYRIRFYPEGSQRPRLEQALLLSGGIRAAKDYALSLRDAFDNVGMVALLDVGMDTNYTYLDNTWEKV